MSPAVREFTAEPLGWRPSLPPVSLDAASPAQREALRETPSGTAISDYVLVLAHDPDSLAQRTPLFNGIRYGRGGASRAERELAATAASVVNRCIYCAAVHAGRFIALTKQPQVMAAVFEGAHAALAPRDAAIAGYAHRLAQHPPQATAADMAALRAAGVSEGEILDLTLAAALFGWANRLMQTLGEPVRPQDSEARR